MLLLSEFWIRKHQIIKNPTDYTDSTNLRGL